MVTTVEQECNSVTRVCFYDYELVTRVSQECHNSVNTHTHTHTHTHTDTHTHTHTHTHAGALPAEADGDLRHRAS
jgi:hypothetical protein